MKNKKFFLLVIFGQCLVLNGCSRTPDYVKEQSKQISNNVEDGEFVLEGMKYNFPFEMQELIDQGWEISSEYTNKDGFQLECFEMSEEFEMRQGQSVISVEVVNMNLEPSELKDCYVQMIDIPLDKTECVFPSGINKNSSFIDLEKKYPVLIKKASQNLSYSTDFVGNDCWECSVDFHLNNNKLSEARYTFLDSDNNINRMYINEEMCKFYFDSAMNSSFHGDYAGYVSMGYDSEENAKQLYEDEQYYYAYELMKYCGIDCETVDDEIVTAYCQVIKNAFENSKWEVQKVELEDNKGTISVAFSPSNIWNITDSVMDELSGKLPDTNKEELTEKEYHKNENEYAKIVLENLEQKKDRIATSDDTKLESFEVDYGNDIISNETWENIDEYFIGRR